MARRMRGGNQGAAIFSVLMIVAALGISIYFYVRPIDSAGKEIAFWCSIVFGITLFSIIVEHFFGNYIDSE